MQKKIALLIILIMFTFNLGLLIPFEAYSQITLTQLPIDQPLSPSFPSSYLPSTFVGLPPIDGSVLALFEVNSLFTSSAAEFTLPLPTDIPLNLLYSNVSTLAGAGFLDTALIPYQATFPLNGNPLVPGVLEIYEVTPIPPIFISTGFYNKYYNYDPVVCCAYFPYNDLISPYGSPGYGLGFSISPNILGAYPFGYIVY